MTPIPNQDLDRLEQPFAAKSRLRQSIVLGSMATGRAHTDSDVDLTVDLGQAMTPQDPLALIGDLAVTCGRHADLVDLHTVGAPMLGQILRHGRRLVGSHADFGRLIASHIADTEDYLPLQRRIQDDRRRTWIGT